MPSLFSAKTFRIAAPALLAVIALAAIILNPSWLNLSHAPATEKPASYRALNNPATFDKSDPRYWRGVLQAPVVHDARRPLGRVFSKETPSPSSQPPSDEP